MRLEVQVDDREVIEALRLIPLRVTRPATRRALQRATRSASLFVGKVIREELNIRASDLRKYVLEKVTPVAESASVTVLGLRVPIEQFVGTRATTKGVSVRVHTNGQRVLIRHAFLYPGGSGQIFVERELRGGRRVGRGPVDRLFGPSPANVAARSEVLARVSTHYQERFIVEWTRDVEARLKGLNQKT